MAPTPAPTPEPQASIRLDQVPGTRAAPTQYDASGKQASYIDDGDVESYAIIRNFGANDTIAFTPLTQWLVAISSAGSDVTITVNKNGVISNIVLRNVISAGQIVYDVASFNALPVGDIRFDATPFATSASLDNAGGTLASPASLDAGGGAFVFTDDAVRASNVRITNFGKDDVLLYTSTYAGAVAVSTKGRDVSFVVNQAGTVSMVTLVNVVPVGALVYDIDSFNALGVGKVQFQ